MGSTHSQVWTSATLRAESSMARIFFRETTSRVFVGVLSYCWRCFTADKETVARLMQVDLENKLPSPVGAGLLSLGNTLGDVINTVFSKMIQNPNGVAACPQFSYSNMSSYRQYCGVRQQPGGIL